MASSDTYTRCYDDIKSNVPGKSKSYDDVFLHDFDIQKAFYHTFEYLCLCGENGITIKKLTPKKISLYKGK